SELRLRVSRPVLSLFSARRFLRCDTVSINSLRNPNDCGCSIPDREPLRWIGEPSGGVSAVRHAATARSKPRLPGHVSPDYDPSQSPLHCQSIRCAASWLRNPSSLHCRLFSGGTDRSCRICHRAVDLMHILTFPRGSQMNGLIRASLGNPYAVTVMSLTLIVLGSLSIFLIPIDILPIFRSPAVQTLTFYNGMSATSIAHDITNGMARQESRSILGASIVRNYFQGDVDPNGALTQVNSLALAAIPNLPPGTLPPVVLPYDPTSTTPVCVVAVDSDDPANNESVLYDVGRYEVRNMIMGQPGAVAPVVYGGKVRAVLAYLDRQKMQARNLSAVDVMNALNAGNVFLPTGDA